MSEFEKDNNIENENNVENEEVFGSDNLGMDNAESDNVDASGEADKEAPSLAKRFFKELLSWILCLAIAFVAAFVIRTWLFTVVKVDGQSMEPTLHHNERLFTRILGYEPERGDIVIFHPKSHPEVAYVKRVIAVEGDRIWVDESNGDVHLKKSGSAEWEVLDENYILEPAIAAGIAQKYADSTGEYGLLIQKDHVFVMGDNRNNSNDSRNDFGSGAVGQVHIDSIIGEAVFRWWPLSEMGVLH